jgi:ribosomal protein S18 acetylase RimI-like enzyme
MSEIQTRFTSNKDIPTLILLEGNVDEMVFFPKSININPTGAILEVIEDDIITAAAYILYKLNDDSVTVLRVCTFRDFRRKGYASRLLSELKARTKRPKIQAFVPDNNLEAQLFFSANEFRANETVERTYLMEYFL